VHPRYPLYIAPKPGHGVFVIGATEIESEDMSPASVRSTLELLSAAYAVHSGFAEARIRGDRHAVPPHAARQPAGHPPAAAARAADQRPVPARFHDRAGACSTRRWSCSCTGARRWRRASGMDTTTSDDA
jgi:hypothetical protein